MIGKTQLRICLASKKISHVIGYPRISVNCIRVYVGNRCSRNTYVLYNVHKRICHNRIENLQVFFEKGHDKLLVSQFFFNNANIGGLRNVCKKKMRVGKPNSVFPNFFGKQSFL